MQQIQYWYNMCQQSEQPNSYKQNNYSSKDDNLAHKLDPEKLETEPTNAYNQPTNNRVKNVITV
jgi:hypothetical protein